MRQAVDATTDPVGMTDAEILEILQGVRNPRERRATAAFELLHATEFSDDPRMKNPSFIAEQLISIPELYEPLRRATTDPDELLREERGRADRVGRPRLKGDIAPVLCAYSLYRQPEMQHYHHYNLESRVWDLARWNTRPSYVTFWSRITEAETRHIPAWERASRYCWAVVRKHIPDALNNWHFDGTPYMSHVLAHHACTDPEACAAAGGDQMPKVIQRAGIEEIDNERHDEQEAPPPPDGEPLGKEMTRESLLQELAERIEGWDDDFEEAALDDAYPEPEIPKYRRKRKPKRPGVPMEKEIFIRNGPAKSEADYKHRYLVRDPDAGFRIYEKNGRKIRQWLGGIAITISDDTTDAQIGTLHIPADEWEGGAFLDALALGVRMTGRLPQNIVADKGHNTRRIRQICGLLGIGLVAPFRRPNMHTKKRKDMRRDTHDEYGIPTCRYCGGSGTTVGKNLGFEIRKGKPVIRYRCANPTKPDCFRRKVQRRACETEWLLLGVLSREDPLYYELRAHGKPQENAHGNARKRTGQAGKDLTSRPKRVGIPFMALRATVGAFLDVFRLCLRFGWLGSHPKPREAVLLRRKGGDEAVASLQRRRRKYGLMLPRGKVAEKLGLVFQGLLPKGYKTVAQRRIEKAKAAKAAAAAKKKAEKAAAKAAATTAAATAGEEANPPPEASAA